MPLPVPRYRAWWAAQDAEPGYRYLRAHLQILQWGRPPAQWMLKSPFHLLRLDALRAVSPAAVVVRTRRDPAEVLPSWCSLVRTVHAAHLER